MAPNNSPYNVIYTTQVTNLCQYPCGDSSNIMWEYHRNFKSVIAVRMLLISAVLPALCEEAPPVTTPAPDCSADDCQPTNVSFTPPPADAMSRLMPPSQHVLSNDTKDPSASNVDIVTTPETSLGLGAYSPFAADRPSTDQQDFSPSPFLGVISEAHISNYGQSIAVGEVFPDSVGDRHLGGHKYLYSISGQRVPHTGHSYHNEQVRTRPTQLSPVDSLEGFGSTDRQPTFRTTSETLRPTSESSYPSLTYSPHKDSSLTSSTKSLGYPVFEIPDRFKEFKDVSNAITDYKPPSPVAFPSYDKPIKEDHYDDRPDVYPTSGPSGPGGRFGGPGGGFGGPGVGFSGPDAFAGSELPAGAPGLPPPPAFTSPPAFFKKPPLGYYGKGGKWGGIFKVLASLIPLGVLLAAFSPSLLVVNATEDPAAPLVEPPSSQSQVQSQALSQAQMQTQALTQPQLPPHVQVVSQPQLSSGGSAEWTKIPTWSPTVATGSTAYRSLESSLGSKRSLTTSSRSDVTPPQIPAGLLMTSCQKRKVCDALTGVDGSYKAFVDSLVYRVGGGFKEIADLALAAKCTEIPCVT